MEEDLKKEFKDFVEKLSVEICKEVLFEQMREINNSFKKTESDFRNSYDTYVKTNRGLSTELEILNKNNKQLTAFTTSIDNTAKKVEKGLQVFNGGYNETIQNIMRANDNLYNRYREKVEQLNEDEREKFVYALQDAMRVQTVKACSSISQIINGGVVNEMNSTLKKLNTNVINLQSEQKMIKEKVISLEKKCDQMKNSMEGIITSYSDNTWKITDKLLSLEKTVGRQYVILIIIAIISFIGLIV